MGACNQKKGLFGERWFNRFFLTVSNLTYFETQSNLKLFPIAIVLITVSPKKMEEKLLRKKSRKINSLPAEKQEKFRG